MDGRIPKRKSDSRQYDDEEQPPPASKIQRPPSYDSRDNGTASRNQDGPHYSHGHHSDDRLHQHHQQEGRSRDGGGGQVYDNPYRENNNIKVTSADLYVGNLPPGGVHPEDLRDLFSRIGPVRSVRNAQAGKNFAFVTMESLADASAAIRRLNSCRVAGYRIKVHEAKPLGGHRSTDTTSDVTVVPQQHSIPAVSHHDQEQPNNQTKNVNNPLDGEPAAQGRGADDADDDNSVEETVPVDDNMTSLPMPLEKWKRLELQAKLQLLLPNEDIFKTQLVLSFKEDWGARCKQAVSKTLQYVGELWSKEQKQKEQQWLNTRNINAASMDSEEEWDEGMEPDYVDMNGASATAQYTPDPLPESIVRFIEALPECYPMHVGFHIYALQGVHRETCYCPCSKHMATFKKQFKLDGIPYCTAKGRFIDFGLRGHLKSPLVVHNCLDLHGIVNFYLETVYSHYHGKDLAHKSMYHKDSKQYLDAEAAQNRESKRTLDFLHSMIAEYERERRELLLTIEKMSEYNPDKADDLREGLDAKEYLASEWNLPPKSPPITYSKEDKDSNRQVADCWFRSFKNNNEASKKNEEANKKNEGKLKVSPDFKLNELFGDSPKTHPTLSKEEKAKALNHPLLSQKKNAATRLVGSRFLNVEYSGDKNLGKNDEEKARDKGGPSRKFLAQVYEQAPKLTLKGKKSLKKILLFQSYHGQLWPTPNDVWISEFGTEEEALKVVRPFTLGIARLMLFALTRDGDEDARMTIAGHMMPDLYVRFFLQGITPANPKYHAQDLLSDVVDQLCSELPEKSKRSDRDTVRAYVDALIEEPSQDEESTDKKEVVLRKAAQAKYIDGCSIVLDGLVEGLGWSADGTNPFLVVLQMMPLSMVRDLFFAKHEVRAKDVIAALKVEVVGDPLPSEGGKMCEVYQQKIISISCDGSQRTGALVDLLERKEKEDPSFPADFLEMVTGCRYLPQHGSLIKIEFNFFELEDENSLPMCHTCELMLKLPGTAYRGDTAWFEERLMYTVQHFLTFRGFNTE